MTNEFGTIAARDLKESRDRGEDMVLINVLPEQMFSEGHIPGSENIPSDRPEFVQEVLQVAGNRNRHIVVYCGGGDRSRSAAEALQQSGFTHVDHFKGGMTEWRAKRYPVETGVHTESRR
jgi:rhodanese-related sulfurtransferase